MKEGAIYSFSDLGDSERELSNMCDAQNVTVSHTSDILQTSEKFFVELLNSVLYINAIQNGLAPEKERFYFPPQILQDVSKNTFKFSSLTGMQVSRQKIYIRGGGREYQHQAVKLKFQELGPRWFLEIEPDFYFTYPNRWYKSRKEIGIRITKQKASMYNDEYLYLLHFWKQFLSKNSDNIILPCDSMPNAQTVIVDAKNLCATSNFKLLNDYHGPRTREEHT